MDRKMLIERFESEMAKVNRPGIDKLMDYIRKSDFYTAPASTKYHLSCEGGLLLHSLNVLDALRGILTPANTQASAWYYTVAGKTAATIPDESVIIMALLHDLCKTYFYGVGTKNVKNEQTGKWEKAPFYTINDKMPLGHGAKSAMIAKNYIELTNMEMYAIWWHMGFNGNTENDACVSLAIEKYPAVLALQTADMQASKLMEAETDNKQPAVDINSMQSQPPEQPETKSHQKTKAKPKPAPADEAPMPEFEDMDFQEAPPLPPDASSGGME